MVQLYDENVGDSLKPAPIVEARKKYKGDFDQYIDEAFENSVFASKDKVNDFLKYFTKDGALFQVSTEFTCLIGRLLRIQVR